MHKLIVPLAIAVLGMSAGSASAASVDYSATCASLTISAPTGTRVLFSVDDEPPGEVADGATTTVALGMPVEVHSYVLFVMVDGVQTDIVEGSVAACAEPEQPVIAEEFVPVAIEERVAEPVIEVSVWAGLSLAPPW
jgi:hypothetical protein